MPTYQYACTECGEPLEVVQSFSDEPLTECPACGGRLRKVFSPVGVVFKGSGFYQTDSRRSEKAKADSAANGGAGAKKSDAAAGAGSGSGSGSASGSSGDGGGSGGSGEKSSGAGSSGTDKPAKPSSDRPASTSSTAKSA
ncbi:MAG: FmdB family transcriptional regulator [Actinomycetota bacterium]|nr:FmdB family transcriptional regulator [Actinomycetota bacterium]